MIRAIFFDLDDTLVDRVRAHRMWAEDFVRRHARFLGGRSLEHALAEMVRVDARGDTDRDTYCAHVAALAPGSGLDGSAVRRDFAVGIVQHTRALPGVHELLRRLAPSYPLRVVTNGPSDVQRGKMRSAALEGLLREVIIAGEVGVPKPHPAIFRQALGSVSCEAREVLFVGDHPENDVAGAAALGMQTCWVALGREWPGAQPRPNHVVDRTPDIVGLLDQ
jgi:putative hydrolase of the HAD superfamily